MREDVVCKKGAVARHQKAGVEPKADGVEFRIAMGRDMLVGRAGGGAVAGTLELSSELPANPTIGACR